MPPAAPSPYPGAGDLERAAAALARRLPAPLARLGVLAYNYGWSWALGAEEVFARVDPERWRVCGHNPVRLLEEADDEALARAASDEGLLDG